MSEIIRCEYIYKTFSPGDVQAVKNVSMNISKGIHIIMGKSGSGKSTLLHILSGLEKPSRGNVYYEGLDMYKEADLDDLRRNHFGFVFQSYNLIPEINVRDNILMPSYIAKRKEIKRYEMLIEKLDLTKKIKQLPETLSGGEQQRVAIARALINSPKVVFADEPTGNLDEYNKNKVMELLVESCRENDATLLMVTHDADQLKYADYSYLMKDGEIINE